MLNRIPIMSCRLVAALTLAAALSQAASAQMFEQPFKNRPTDRAGMAVVMKQVSSGMFDSRSTTTGSSAGSSTVLLCGGPDGGSTATSNSSCIILGDGASGLINLGQASEGNQDAEATQTQTTSSTELSDALSALTE